MIGRSFVVVDDMPLYARKVENYIKEFYSKKGLRVWESDVVKITSKKVFLEAKEYVETYFNKIDVIFCDQNLKKDLGTELFKQVKEIVFKTEYKSIVSRISVYKVIHSFTSKVFLEYQSEILEYSDYFVKSVGKEFFFKCLDYYEEYVLKTKQVGNVAYVDHLYQKGKDSQSKKKVFIDGKQVRLNDILILVLDPTRGNSDYYYFFYKEGDEIIRTPESRKPDFENKYENKKHSFNSTLNEFSFIKGTLAFDKNLQQDKNILFKVNPLWFSSIDYLENEIILLPVCSKRFEIKFDTVDQVSLQIVNRKLDKFFL